MSPGRDRHGQQPCAEPAQQGSVPASSHTPHMALDQAPDYAVYVSADDEPALHWGTCPNLDEQARQSLTIATAEQRNKLPPCRHCWGAIGDVNRDPYTSLDEAMEALPLAVENRARAREIIAREAAQREIPYPFLWIPPSRQYIGMSSGPRGVAVAYVNRGFVEIHRGAGRYQREVLPTHGASSGGARSGRSAAPEQAVCPKCFTQLPATGRCDTCDA